MTKLLKEAFDRASELSHEAQDQLAEWLLEELSSEERWSQLVDASSEKISKLATEALVEHRSGRTEPLDPDAL